MSPPSKVNLEKLRFSRKEIDRARNCDFKTGAVIKPDVNKHHGWLSYREVVMFQEVDIKSRWYSECEGTSKSGFLYSDELKILSRCDHYNILPFTGYCDEKEVFFQEGVDDGDKVILVYEYEEGYQGSLAEILRIDKNISWAERLEICIGIAKGLNYLHSGVEEVGRVIHNDIQSKNIMIDYKLKPKIMGFYHSVILPENQLHTQVNSHVRHEHHPDPIYHEIGLLDTTTDVYSYGILMFEILMWMVANDEKVIGDYKPQRLINIVRRCYDNKPEQLIDPGLRDHIDRRSFQMFIDIAYRCISFNLKDRPTMNEVAKMLTKALDIHKRAPSPSGYLANTLKFYIPLMEIDRAISGQQEITRCSYGNKLYRAHLYNYRQDGPVALKICDDNYSFQAELKIVSRLHHENIIRFIGYSIKGKEDILVYECADNGSLSTYLHKLTWAQRLKICIGAAKGLKYLHSGLGEYESVIHGEFTSQNILVSDNLEAKICGLGSSFLVPRNSPDTKVYKTLVGGQEMDPVYRESYIPKVESNVYSLGVVLFEILTGKLVNTKCRTKFDEAHSPKIIQNEEHNNNKKNRGFLKKLTLRHKFPWVSWDSSGPTVVLSRDPRGPTVVLSRDPRGPTLVESLTKCDGDEELNLMALVRRHYGDGFDEFIDPQIRDEIDVRSLHICKEIAYKCISYQIKDRPSLNKIIKRLEEALYIQNHRATSTVTGRGLQHQKLEDFFIPLNDINLAIGVKGPNTQIGAGGFGEVYKGQLRERWQNHTVAIKCLCPESYQGEYEFRNELNMIFSFSHENIIPFIGYCDECKEKIIVYEYASNGSLDQHLENKEKRRILKWERRLKICLGAARGLDYLHTGLGEDNRVIHRDIKSGNILLDHDFVAKVCDFGLSKYGPTNQPQTQVYTNAAGTNFYMDPIYHESGVLRKESDVYSFGVVMFELLCGMLAHHRRRIGDDKQKPLINLVRRYYDYRPDLLVDPLIKDEIDSRSFNAFREIAFQCISYNSKERPTMEAIGDRVEEALELQVTNQGDLRQKVTESLYIRG